MYEKIYLDHSAESKLLVCSDPHLGHDRDFIWGPRGHQNVRDHDAEFELNFNAKVGANDVVLMLGDWMFGEKADLRTLDLFKKLNFRELYLSPGNHNSGWRQLYLHCKERIFHLPKSVECYPLRVELRKMFGDEYPENKWVIFMPNYYEVQVGDQFVVCCHYPISSWNKNGKGAWMLSGHVHGRFEGSKKSTTDAGKVLDLGPENVGMAPLDFDEIGEIMKTKSIKVVDHHGAHTPSP